MKTEKVIDILIKSKTAGSKSEARRLILQNAIGINGVNIKDIDCEVEFNPEKALFIRKGKYEISYMYEGGVN